MSDFVSVHDVVFGNRPPETSESNDNGSRKTTITVRPDEAPVDIQLVASAVELDGIFCFDDYGRFGLANDEQKDKILDVLKMHGRLCNFSHAEEIDRYETEISDQTKFSEWHMFGWLIGELPDFEACYQQWKSKHNTSGKEPNLKAKRLENPRKSNTIWVMVEGLVTSVISEHLASNGKTTNDIIAELTSKTRSTETMRLLNKLQHLAPDSFNMDEKTFRSKLKDIFNK